MYMNIYLYEHVCMNIVSMSACVSCAFSLALFILFVLSYSSLFCLV